MKSVGIIGGLGPETTAKFYLELISSCQIYNKKAYPLYPVVPASKSGMSSVIHNLFT